MTWETKFKVDSVSWMKRQKMKWSPRMLSWTAKLVRRFKKVQSTWPISLNRSWGNLRLERKITLKRPPGLSTLSLRKRWTKGSEILSWMLYWFPTLSAKTSHLQIFKVTRKHFTNKQEKINTRLLQSFAVWKVYSKKVSYDRTKTSQVLNKFPNKLMSLWRKISG